MVTERKKKKKKKRIGRPPGIESDITPQWKREWMFLVYAEKQVVDYVARQCRVSSPTVKKFKIKDEWDKRLELQRRATIADAELQAAGDRELATALAWIKVLIGQAVDSALEKGYKDAKDAVNAFEKLIKLGRLLKGEPTERKESLIAIAGARFRGELPDGDSHKIKRINAEFTTENSDPKNGV